MHANLKVLCYLLKFFLAFVMPGITEAGSFGRGKQAVNITFLNKLINYEGMNHRSITAIKHLNYICTKIYRTFCCMNVK